MFTGEKINNMSLYRLILFDYESIPDDIKWDIDLRSNILIHDSEENIYFVKSKLLENKIRYYFIISSQKIINDLNEILKNKINYKIDNITIDFIHGNRIEGIEYIENKNFFNNYRLNLITIDDILDKINTKGIESLNEFDKMILKTPIK